MIITLDTGWTIVLRLAGSQEALQNALSAHRLQLVESGDRQLISVKPEKWVRPTPPC